MQNKRPYKHILKNLFHEQATEIIPLLLPEYQVTRVIDVELPELKQIPMEEPPSVMEQGIVGLAGLALPEAKILKVYRTEFIEHSGKFERAYRAQGPHTSKPVYLVIEFQTDRDDEDLTRRLVLNHVQVDHYTKQDMPPERGSRGEG